MYQRVPARAEDVKVDLGERSQDGRVILAALSVLASYANTIEGSDGRLKTTELHAVDIDGNVALVRQVEHTADELGSGADPAEHQVDPNVPEEIADDLPDLARTAGPQGAEVHTTDAPDPGNPNFPDAGPPNSPSAPPDPAHDTML